MTQMTAFSFGTRRPAQIDEFRPVASEVSDRLARAIAGLEVPA